MLFSRHRMDDHDAIIRSLAKAAASPRAHQVPQKVVGWSLEVGRPARTGSQAHAEAFAVV